MSEQKDAVPDLMDFTVQLAYKNLIRLLIKNMMERRQQQRMKAHCKQMNDRLGVEKQVSEKEASCRKTNGNLNDYNRTFFFFLQSTIQGRGSNSIWGSCPEGFVAEVPKRYYKVI